MQPDNKHLMTGPAGNSEFSVCLPTLRVLGKQNSLFPLWPVVKCLLTELLLHTNLGAKTSRGKDSRTKAM